jgi:hypothetical protein
VRPHHPARAHNPARRGPPPSSVDRVATSPSAGTHRGLASTIAPPPPLRLLIRNEPRAADLAAAIRGINNLHAAGDLGPAATSPSAPHLECTAASPPPSRHDLPSASSSATCRDVPSAIAPLIYVPTPDQQQGPSWPSSDASKSSAGTSPPRLRAAACWPPPAPRPPPRRAASWARDSSKHRLQGGIPRNPAAAVCEGDDPSGAVERNFSRAAQAERQTNGRAELPRDPGLLPTASLCLSQIESAHGLPVRPQGEALLTAPSPSLSPPPSKFECVVWSVFQFAPVLP